MSHHIDMHKAIYKQTFPQFNKDKKIFPYQHSDSNNVHKLY